MGITKVRSNQIYGVNSGDAFAPFILDVTPQVVAPLSVNTITVKGAFFNTNTTITTASGNTISNIVFISDNEMNFELEANSAEGTFNFTIDNGNGTKAFSISVIDGVVYIPSQADWEDANNQIDLSEDGAIKLVNFQQYASARWSKVIDTSIDTSVRFTPRQSPKGEYVSAQYNNVHIALKKVSNNTNLAAFSLYKHSSGFYNNAYSANNGWGYVGTPWTNGDWADRWAAIENAVFEWRFISGVMYFYIQGNLVKTFGDTINENVKLDIEVNEYEFKNIKYVELP